MATITPISRAQIEARLDNPKLVRDDRVRDLQAKLYRAHERIKFLAHDNNQLREREFRGTR